MEMVKDQKMNKKTSSGKTYIYSGTGLAIGTGLAMIWGPMLSEVLNQGLTIVIGAALGLIIGAAIDMYGHRKTDSKDLGDD